MARQLAAVNTSTASVPASNHGKRIGILVVAYNAVSTLASVLRRIPADVWDSVEEVVVFDDASDDATYELAVGYKMTSGIDKLTIIRNERNVGYGGNQKLGYEYFISKGFDIVVLLHGDGQYAPEILAHLYAPVVTGEAAAVLGSRMLPGYGGPLKGGMPLYKFIGNRILTWFENRALHMNLTEFHSGYRAYSLAALQQIDMSKMTDDFHFDTEIIVKLNHHGFRIKEVPIPAYYGSEINRVNGLKYAWHVIASVIRYRRAVASGKSYPEYEEYVTHYSLKGGRYSSHYWVHRLVGKGKDVLDVGCGEGFFAATLREQGNRVAGVDRMLQPAVPSAFEKYVQADLDSELGRASQLLQGRRFDRVLLQDVLEHVRYPERLLRECRDFLKPEGQVIVSVPNIANITVRISLLFGRWEYTERGILDKTHLWFFTRRTARRFLESHGYELIWDTVTVMPIELALALPPDHLLVRTLNPVLALATALLPGLLGYQCLLVARPKEVRPVLSDRPHASGRPTADVSLADPS